MGFIIISAKCLFIGVNSIIVAILYIFFRAPNIEYNKRKNRKRINIPTELLSYTFFRAGIGFSTIAQIIVKTIPIIP
jgi:hypothetical protein